MNNINGGLKWKRLYESLSDQVEVLEGRVKDMGAKAVIMKLNLENAQKAVDINKQMLRDSVTEYNQKEQEYIGLINKLKEKLRALGYADFRGLGE
jgi:hypothetical protein